MVAAGSAPAVVVAATGSAGAAAGAAGPAAGAAAGARLTGTSLASLPSRQSTNWPSNFADTSLIIPLPNCAILPEIFRSVSTLTTVFEPSARKCAVIIAAAWPAPRASRPLASMTAR